MPRPTPRLALYALLLGLTVVSCGPFAPGPTDVALEELVAEQESYDGQVVRTVGVVRSHDEPLHYWIEDDHPNRVELVPHEAAEPFLGEHVRVLGPFSYSPDRGRWIDVEEIEIRAP